MHLAVVDVKKNGGAERAASLNRLFYIAVDDDALQGG